MHKTMYNNQLINIQTIEQLINHINGDFGVEDMLPYFQNVTKNVLIWNQSSSIIVQLQPEINEIANYFAEVEGITTKFTSFNNNEIYHISFDDMDYFSVHPLVYEYIQKKIQ